MAAGRWSAGGRDGVKMGKTRANTVYLSPDIEPQARIWDVSSMFDMHFREETSTGVQNIRFPIDTTSQISAKRKKLCKSVPVAEVVHHIMAASCAVMSLDNRPKGQAESMNM